MENSRIMWVEAVKQTEAHSDGSKDAESNYVGVEAAVEVPAAAAGSEPEFDSIPQVKQVEVEFVSAIVPINHDPTHTEEEADDVAVPEPSLGPIHHDLHSREPLEMMVGG
jgi:hypothetical protein